MYSDFFQSCVQIIILYLSAVFLEVFVSVLLFIGIPLWSGPANQIVWGPIAPACASIQSFGYFEQTSHE